MRRERERVHGSGFKRLLWWVQRNSLTAFKWNHKLAASNLWLLFRKQCGEKGRKEVMSERERRRGTGRKIRSPLLGYWYSFFKWISLKTLFSRKAHFESCLPALNIRFWRTFDNDRHALTDEVAQEGKQIDWQVEIKPQKVLLSKVACWVINQLVGHSNNHLSPNNNNILFNFHSLGGHKLSVSCSCDECFSSESTR